MKKIYNSVASEYEMPEQRYLRCQALTGEWWYKDMETGEDLPLFTQPINWQHNDTLTFNQEKVIEEFVNEVIDPTIKCKQFQERIDKALEFLDGYEDMVGLTGTLVYNIKYILQGKDKGEDK